MSKTYIVETDDETQLLVEIGVNSTGAALIATNPVSFLTPYTEPDTEQVGEDAFKNGYDAACKDIDVKSKTNAAYRNGLYDAWDVARKIVLSEADGGIQWKLKEQWFGKFTIYDIFKDVPAMDVIEKIRQYGREQGKIKVGDEVDGKGGRGIIAKISDDCDHFNVMWENGSTGYYMIKDFKKTGRHYPEIAEVLRKMREEES